MTGRQEATSSRSGVRRAFPALTRTHIVWASFAAAMTAVSGLLLAVDDQERHSSIAPLTLMEVSQPGAEWDPVKPRGMELDRQRWKAIVIHHSGGPAGDMESLERDHRAAGLSGLGYHFVIGNGHGIGDGVVHVGYRWDQQQPGAHVAGGPDSIAGIYNRHSIGICLVGNGNRREFTDRQIRELIRLVKSLQVEMDIPSTAVHLHSDLAEVRNPGMHFPVSLFESQLID